jgi:hypothetical protein
VDAGLFNGLWIKLIDNILESNLQRAIDHVGVIIVMAARAGIPIGEETVFQA